MIALEVKDLGADATLGPLRRITVQRKRFGKIESTAKRVAQVPCGWTGRLCLTTSLLKAAAQWGYDITGISAKATSVMRHWLMHAITGGSTARRAPEVVFALVSPTSWVDPELHLTNIVIGGGIKKAAQQPLLRTDIQPAWDKEINDPAPVENREDQRPYSYTKNCALGWRPTEPTTWHTSEGDPIDVTNAEMTRWQMTEALTDCRWKELADRRTDFEGAHEG
eukprot:14727402-Heterocapsa_arctica.AAC.1